MSSRWQIVIITTILTVFAFFVRLYGLADKPFWLDELTTQRRVNFLFWDLIANSLHYGQLPTYFAALHALSLPTLDEWTLRLPSVIFGTISVLLVTLIASEVRSPRAGFVAGLLMAVSPFEVQFGQEARPGTLIACCILLALWGLVRIAKQASGATSLSSDASRMPGSWVAYVGGTILALNIQFVSTPWLIASNLAMAKVILRSGPKRISLIRYWAAAQVVIVLSWLPGLIALYLANQNDPFRNLQWIPPLTLEKAWSAISAVYLFQVSDIVSLELLPTLVPGFGIAIVVLALLGTWRLKNAPTVFGVIGLAAIAMPVTILITSIFCPILIPRYLIWSTGPFYVLAGIAAAAMSKRAFSLAATALVVGGVVNLAPYYSYETKPRWDLAAAYLAANVRPGEIVIVNNVLVRYVLVGFGDRYHLDEKIVGTASSADITAILDAEVERIWFVYGRVGQALIDEDDAYGQKIAASGKVGLKVTFGKHIAISCMDIPRNNSNFRGCSTE
jgi:mannosyltransferase